MKYLDLSLPTAAENLACDEALLDWAGAEGKHEVLRMWEPKEYFVVLGYANKASGEINLETCRKHGVPIFRRCSGGGAVLQGPGCLNYSLILRIQEGTPLHGISETNCFIMKSNAEAISSLLGQPVEVAGFTDLVLQNLKFSGNAQRRKRDWLLFHGTFLFDFKIERVQELLLPPSKQPAYRQNRSHLAFLTQLKAPAAAIKTALRAKWRANETLKEMPRVAIDKLVREKYSKAEWNLKW